jgi:hypothetical protein
MATSDFHHTPLSRVGAFLDWLFGPSETGITQGPAKTRTVTLRTADEGYWPRAIISCTRVIHRTTYERWWIPSVVQSLYEVSIHVPESTVEQYGSATFESITYPLLCNELLQGTTYPHVCAIGAFVDQMAKKILVVKAKQSE